MFKVISGIVVIALFCGFSFNCTSSGNANVLSSQDSLGQYVESYDFGADLYVASHQNIEDLLSVIQKKYEGKAVILDLWGTFCKPCLEDFKKSPAVKAQLKEEHDVHMVYLCAGMSSKPNDWKKIIERDQLHGDHIYMDTGITMADRKKFDVKRYPNYVLMDKEGNFKTNIISAVSKINVSSFQHHL